MAEKLYDKLKPIPLEKNPVAQSIIELMKMYDKIVDDINKEALRFLEGKSLLEESTFYKLEKVISEKTERLNLMAERWAAYAIPESYLAGEDLVRWMADEVEERGSEFLAPRDQKRYNEFIDRMSKKVYREVKMVNDGMRQRLDDIIYQGLKEGQSVELTKRPGIRGGKTTKDQIGTRLYQTIVDEGLKLEDSIGRKWTPSRYARMYARTRTREVQTQGMEDTLANNGLDLVQISKHTDIDGQDICNEFEDNIYSLSGTHPKYPMLTVHTPFHPNCGHVETPYPEELRDFIKARKEGKTVEEAANVEPKQFKDNDLPGFKPAETLEEAKKEALKVFETVEMNNVTLEQLNEINRGIHVGRQGLPLKVKKLNWMNGSRHKGASGLCTTLKHQPEYVLNISFKKTHVRNPAKFLDDFKEDFRWYRKNTLQKLEEQANDPRRPDWLLKQNKEKLNQMKSVVRWSSHTDVEPEDFIFAISSHETGHGIYYYNGLESTWTEKLKEYKITKTDKLKLSEYAATNDSELFAEVNAFVSLNREKDIPENLLKAYKETIKGAK